MVVYSAGGSISSPGYPNSYYGQPHGCSKSGVEVEEGYSLAMKLEFETQCCAGYSTWRDDNITITDGNRSTIFDQREGFSFSSDGKILVNSFTNTASLKFCKVSLFYSGDLKLSSLPSTSVSSRRRATTSGTTLLSSLLHSTTMARLSMEISRTLDSLR